MGHHFTTVQDVGKVMLGIVCTTCSLCYREGAIKLESVQKRFRKLLSELESLKYKDRSGSFSLVHKRLRSNLVEVYKIMRCIGMLYCHSFLPRQKRLKLEGIGLK